MKKEKKKKKEKVRVAVDDTDDDDDQPLQTKKKGKKKKKKKENMTEKDKCIAQVKEKELRFNIIHDKRRQAPGGFCDILENTEALYDVMPFGSEKPAGGMEEKVAYLKMLDDPLSSDRLQGDGNKKYRDYLFRYFNKFGTPMPSEAAQ